MNASEEVVLSVSGQKDSQAISYNWYLDNTFQDKVRASDLSEELHTQKINICHEGKPCGLRGGTWGALETD